MKKILISILVISVLLNIFLFIKTLGDTMDTKGIFQREKDKWVFYETTSFGSKKATGLEVDVIKNTNVPDWPEEIYSTISPDGKKVIFMQKPAWPHKIYISNINGSEQKEFIGPLEAPTHKIIENQFVWLEDNLIYAVTNQDCGPQGSGGSYETVLYKKSYVTEKEEEVDKIEHNCNDVVNGGKVILVK